MNAKIIVYFLLYYVTHDLDNHNGVITHLELGILEWGQAGLRKHHYKQN